MIPVSITIKGLYSYQQETIIDFRPLTAAGLFGIFGAVGSGKSSILEAITFALYGETDRLNSKDARGYNMMNLKSNELFIDFIFLSGTPEKKFRFMVKSKRNRKRFNETTPFERSAYELIEENWQPTAKTADEILGLSYKNFRRTVIIPQGKFQEFLQLKDFERVQMLKEIFNLEKYELGPAVATLTKQNDLRISNLEGQMMSIPQIEEKAIELINQKVTLLEQTLIKETAELKIIQDKEKALDTLKNLFTNLQIKKEKWNGLKNNEREYVQLEKDVLHYENCEKAFKNLLINKNQLDAALKILQADIEHNNTLFNKLHQQIVECEEVQNSLKDKYINRDKLLQQADELAKIITIGQLYTKIKEYNQRIINGKKLIAEKEASLTTAKVNVQQLQQILIELESKLSAINLLVQLNNWYTQFDQYKNELKQSVTEETNLESEINKHIQSINHYLKQLPLKVHDEKVPTFLEVKDEVEQLQEINGKEISAIKNEIAHLKLTEKLEEFIQQIKTGEPCPLCGSENHPHLLSVEDVSERMVQLNKKEKQLQTESEQQQQCLMHLSSLYANYNTLTTATINVRNKIKLQKQALESYEQSFSFPSYTINDYQKVTNELKLSEQNNIKIASYRQQLATAQNNCDQTQNAISDYQKGLEKIQLEIAGFNAERETLERQIININKDEWIHLNESQLKAALLNYKEVYNKVTTEFEKNQIDLQKLYAEQNIIKGKLDEIKKQQQIQELEFTKISTALNEKLNQFGFANENEVNVLLTKSINITQEKERLKTFQNEIYAATIQLNEAENLTAGKYYEAKAHLALIEELKIKTEVVQKHHEDFFTTKQEAEIQKKYSIKRLALQQEFDLLTNRASDLKILNNLFRSAGFVNYVSGVYLHNLVNAANNRFHKMTNQKLLLELTEDNSFLVRDFLNNGETRSVKTLSGGQTFQAALSLALSLADNIEHLSKSTQNFFFLDEGFGTLDKESLQIAFNTLQGLKKENRIVGIISHVEEMQQEVEIYLQVTNQTDMGSIVKTSWSI